MADAVLDKLKEMSDKQDCMVRKLDDMRLWQGVHDERHERVERDLTDARKTLYQNPGGIVSKVDRLCNGKKALKSWREFAMAVGIRLFSWAAIGIIVWLLFMYKKH